MKQLLLDFSKDQQRIICACGNVRHQPTQRELIEEMRRSIWNQLIFYDRRERWRPSANDEIDVVYLHKCYTPFHYYLGECAEKHMDQRMYQHSLSRASLFTTEHPIECLVFAQKVRTVRRGLWVENVTRDDLAKKFPCNYFANGFLAISHDGRTICPADLNRQTTLHSNQRRYFGGSDEH